MLDAQSEAAPEWEPAQVVVLVGREVCRGAPSQSPTSQALIRTVSSSRPTSNRQSGVAESGAIRTPSSSRTSRERDPFGLARLDVPAGQVPDVRIGMAIGAAMDEQDSAVAPTAG